MFAQLSDETTHMPPVVGVATTGVVKVGAGVFALHVKLSAVLQGFEPHAEGPL